MPCKNPNQKTKTETTLKTVVYSKTKPKLFFANHTLLLCKWTWECYSVSGVKISFFKLFHIYFILFFTSAMVLLLSLSVVLLPSQTEEL